jgi:phosphoglycolate phosphatase-like HAD superfamily hydrolase
VLGLSRDVRACVFDFDGVMTQTAKVHRVVADLGELLRAR